MSSAPKLRVIEGGRAVSSPAPSLPPAIGNERLYPISASIDRRGAFFLVVAASLIFHGIVLLASVDWNILGEERVAGGSGEDIVVDGIDVILVDQVPSVPPPLSEAREITENDIRESLPSDKASSIVADDRVAEVPVDPATPTFDTAAVAASEDLSATVETAEASSTSPDTLSPIDSTPADEVPATTVAAGLSSSEAPGAPLDAVQPKAAETAPLVRRDDWGATVSAPAANASSDDKMIRPARAPVAQGVASAEARPAEPSNDLADVTPVTPEPAKSASPTDTRPLGPIEEASPVAATEVMPEPPLPVTNPLKIVQSQPEARTPAASIRPQASASASAVDAAAHGPKKTKSNAGSGGKSDEVRGTADLSNYQSRLVAHLRRFRTYPAAARQRHLEGTASVRVTINRDGRVIAVALAKSSGYAVLDREAVAMARRASPFPAIPPGLGRSQITIRAPIRFTIR